MADTKKLNKALDKALGKKTTEVKSTQTKQVITTKEIIERVDKKLVVEGGRQLLL